MKPNIPDFKLVSAILVFSILCLFNKGLNAQEIRSDTSFFIQGIKVSSPDSADAFKIVIYYDTSFHKVYERIFAIEGNLLEETHYSNFKMDEMNLFHREFYDNRKVYKYIGYDKGRLQGKFQVFHPNGIKKRDDLYDKGNWVKGICYDSTGVPVKYIPFHSGVSFIQGDFELRARIQSELSMTMKNAGTKFGYSNLGDASLAGKVVLRFVIDKNGVMKDLKVLESPNPEMNDKVINAVIKIRGWNPASENGEYIDSIVTLPIVVFMN